MNGLRIISPSITPQTELTEGLKLLVDKEGFSQAKSLDVKYLGNSIVQGKDIISDPWGIVKDTSTIFRISTDGGTTWSQNIFLPSEQIYNSLQFSTAPTIEGHSAGRMFWDSEARTLAVNTDVVGVTLQIGQEQYVRVRNNTGSPIDNGKVVYLDTAIGQTPTIKLANASEADTSNILGLVTEDINNNSFGYVTTYGIVRDIDTLDYPEGAILYLSNLDGLLSITPPIKPEYAIRVGICLYSHGTHGRILVYPGLDWSTQASLNNLNINGTLETLDIITDNTKYHYFGEPTTNGSWRMGVSGDNFIIQKRESGSWVTKSTITP